MSVYVISDTHFNHKNIIEYESRPFNSVEEMNNALIKNWNAIIKPEDIVIHLGDVGLGRESDLKWIVPSLNGYKILIRGNHDTKSKNFYLECGFNEVRGTFVEHIGRHDILFSHRPEGRPGDNTPYDLHIYGHVHSKDFHGSYPTIARNGACVCVERWDYRPVLLEHVIELCEQAGISAANI